MITTVDRQRVARALLTYMAEPGDPVLAAWLEVATPADAIDSITAGRLPLLPAMGPGSLGDLQAEKVEHAFGIWRQRLGDLPGQLDLDEFGRAGIRLVCPGEDEWPTQLDTLGVTRPYALWLRGEADLRYCCLQSVSIVGARASSGYGEHVGTEMAAALAERGWTVVSGGAYGIDGCAHRGALAADGVTVAVLACGVDHAYPPGHYELLTSIAAQGVLVSEWPPGRVPNKLRFLIRNRVIGALTRGTVVVEAGQRSGALSTARHARDLRRPLMAVPGPVTSEVSAGCHRIIREWGAVCVTSAHDVIDLLTPLCEVPGYGSAASPYVYATPDDGPGGPEAPAGPDHVRGHADHSPGAPGGSRGMPSRSPGMPGHSPDPSGSSPGSPGYRPGPSASSPAPSAHSPGSSGYRPGPTADKSTVSRPAWFPTADPARAAGPVRATGSADATFSARAASARAAASAAVGAPPCTKISDGPDSPVQAVGPGHQLRPVTPFSSARRPLMTAPPVPTGRRAALLPRDKLAPASRAVLDAIPARGAGPAVIAVKAGLEVDTVVSTLGLLAAGGFVERCPRGWRIRRSP
jgi:DNA processing protein